MVKLGYDAYNIVTTEDILFFAGVRFTICGALICLYAFITDGAMLLGENIFKVQYILAFLLIAAGIYISNKICCYFNKQGSCIASSKLFRIS